MNQREDLFSYGGSGFGDVVTTQKIRNLNDCW